MSRASFTPHVIQCDPTLSLSLHPMNGACPNLIFLKEQNMFNLGRGRWERPNFVTKCKFSLSLPLSGL